ncbi:MAG: peptidyl-prolyl cis-trans isomerase [Pseudomonadota bacterium]|nr:MAG: peptidylprolyl isomerase [Pseudomonadota bacterium]
MSSAKPGLLIATLLALAVPSVSVVALAQTAKDGNSGKAATVNGVAIPKARVDMILKAQEAQGQPSSPELRTAVTRELIMREIIEQEAKKRGLTKNPEVQAQIDFARQNVLFNAYREDFQRRNPITEAQLKAEYERIKKQMGDTEYKARHILVGSEAEAREIIAQLDKGAKFEELASKSKDPGSSARGGDLDWNSASAYVEPFGQALAKLNKGEYTKDPVQTQFGWHVIKLEDTRPAKFPSLEEVKPGLTQRLQNQALEQHLRDLWAKAKIE